MLRRAILQAITPVTQWLSRIHLPFTRKLVTGRHYMELFPKLRAGTVLCTKIRGELSNIFIPGFYSHAAIYIGGGWVVEATSRGVVKTDLVSFMLTKDYVLAREPIFASRGDMELAAQWALRQIGKPYDWEFSPGVRSFYCSELVALSYWQNPQDPSPFPARETLGVMTWTPDDIALADKKWKTIWDSKTSLVTA